MSCFKQLNDIVVLGNNFLCHDQILFVGFQNKQNLPAEFDFLKQISSVVLKLWG